MITKCTAAQLDRVMEIWLDTNIAAHPFVDRRHWEDAFDAVRSALPAADLFVYESGVEVAGFVGVTGGSYIAGLFVAGEHQSRGVGRALLEHCKGIYARLELDVFTENQGAVRFYERSGFAITGTKENRDFGHQEHRMVWTR